MFSKDIFRALGRTSYVELKTKAVSMGGAYGGFVMLVQARETINKAVTHCGV